MSTATGELAQLAPVRAVRAASAHLQSWIRASGSTRRAIGIAIGAVLGLHAILALVLAVSCGDLRCDDQGVNWYGSPPAGSGWQGLLVGPWLRGDAVYYAQIATDGYVPAGTTAGPLGVFYPLFPLLARGLMPVLGGQPVMAGLAVNAMLTVVALVLLRSLVGDEAGPRAARSVTMLICASPAAFFLLAPLSEATFFTFTLATVVAARRGRIGVASLLAVGATLSRDQGILVMIPLAAAALQRARARLAEGRCPLQWSDASLALAPLSFLAFQVYLTGHGYGQGTLGAEAVYMHTHLAAPWSSIAQSVALVVSRADAPELVNLVAVILLAASIPVMWRRLRRSDTAYAVASLLVVVCHVGGFSPLESALRFTVMTYPIWLLLGSVAWTTQRLRAAIPALAASSVLVAAGVAGFHMVQ
jgi:hypothetical protein